MTGKTTIEWTHQPGYRGASWNPTVGCTRVSAGCDNCYAFALHDQRYASNLAAYRKARPSSIGMAREWVESGGFRAESPALVGVKGGMTRSRQYDLPFSRVQLLEDRLDVPLRTRTPTCYFVDSMADLFHEDVPDEFIARVFDAMCAVPYKDGEPKRGWWDENPHRYLILTKRPERMRRFIESIGYIVEQRMSGDSALSVNLETGNWPLPNVWLGTSVEDQKAADERIPHLLATPAAVRFLSCEPLLGPVDLELTPMRANSSGAGDNSVTQRRSDGHGDRSDREGSRRDHLGEGAGDPTTRGRRIRPDIDRRGDHGGRSDEAQGEPIADVSDPWVREVGDGLAHPHRLDWVIVGGESGSRARPMDLAWARSLVAQCRAAGVAPFVKQLGSVPFASTDEWTTGGIDYKTGRYPLHPYDKSMAFYPKLRESHGREMTEWPDDLRVRDFPNGA